jgi:hypothetical protein
MSVANTSVTSNSPFLNLPEDLHLHILSFVVDCREGKFLNKQISNNELNTNVAIFRTCKAMQHCMAPFLGLHDTGGAVSNILRHKLASNNALLPAKVLFTQAGNSTTRLNLQDIQTTARGLSLRISECFLNITELNLNNTVNFNDKSYEPLVNLPNLKTLFLDNTAFLTDQIFEPISRIQTLESLSLDNARSLGDSSLEHIGSRLVNLVNLNIKSCSGFTPNGFKQLHNLKQLKTLNCEELGSINRVSLREINKITTLESLNFNLCLSLNDDYIPLLAPLTALRTLELNSPSNNFSANGIASLTDTVPQLQHLSLNNCRHLQNITFLHLARFTQLESLNLQGAMASNYSLKMLARVTSLTHLDLSGKQNYTDVGLLDLATLENLKSLHLTKRVFHDGFNFILNTIPSPATVEKLKNSISELTITVLK